MKQPLDEATLPAVMVKAVVETAVRRGLRREAIVPPGFDLETLSPEALVPLSVMFSIFETIMRALRDPGFPLQFAAQFKIEDYPLLGFALMTAPSGREALLRARRFGALVTRSAEWQLIDRGELTEVVWDRPGLRSLGHRVANESAVAELFSGMQQALGRTLRATAVHFRHPAPDDVSAHERYFGCPVTWASERDSLTLSTALLELAPRFSNLALGAHFEHEAMRRVEAMTRDDSVRTRVAAAVRDALPGGEPSLPVIAKRLAKTERTLRRALQAEGTTFRVVLDQVRQAQATALLDDARLSLGEIAFALGFSEHAAFTRAFKRWFGRPPIDARREG